MSDTIWQVITGAVILGVILLLVNPNSPGPQAVLDVADSLQSLITTATGNAPVTPASQQAG